MSDKYISIIPETPDFVPDEARQAEGVAYFRSITAPGTEIDISVSEQVKFVDCGANFVGVKCPTCSIDVNLETWQNWMESDLNDEGFTLNYHTMPCCGSEHTLNGLRYHYPQGFARFILTASNPGVEQLSEEQLTRFEEILDCSIRIIYKQY